MLLPPGWAMIFNDHNLITAPTHTPHPRCWWSPLLSYLFYNNGLGAPGRRFTHNADGGDISIAADFYRLACSPTSMTAPTVAPPSPLAHGNALGIRSGCAHRPGIETGVEEPEDQEKSSDGAEHNAHNGPWAQRRVYTAIIDRDDGPRTLPRRHNATYEGTGARGREIPVQERFR